MIRPYVGAGPLDEGFYQNAVTREPHSYLRSIIRHVHVHVSCNDGRSESCYIFMSTTFGARTLENATTKFS